MNKKQAVMLRQMNDGNKIPKKDIRLWDRLNHKEKGILRAFHKANPKTMHMSLEATLYATIGI